MDNKSLIIALATLGLLYFLSKQQPIPQPTPQPQPQPVPQPTQQVKQNWIQIYGIDPNIILQYGTKISEQEWLNTQAKYYGISPSLFIRFTGSNGTVAYAYAPGGQPKKIGEDYLGQPLLTSSTGGQIYIINWNPYMFKYGGTVYDLLAYVIRK